MKDKQTMSIDFPYLKLNVAYDTDQEHHTLLRMLLEGFEKRHGIQIDTMIIRTNFTDRIDTYDIAESDILYIPLSDQTWYKKYSYPFTRHPAFGITKVGDILFKATSSCDLFEYIAYLNGLDYCGGCTVEGIQTIRWIKNKESYTMYVVINTCSSC